MPIFDHNQEYQLNAIQSITTICANLHGLHTHHDESCLHQDGAIFSNAPSEYSFTSNREVFRQNLLQCQAVQEIPVHLRHETDELVTDCGTPIRHATEILDHTIESTLLRRNETGTEKRMYIYANHGTQKQIWLS